MVSCATLPILFTTLFLSMVVTIKSFMVVNPPQQRHCQIILQATTPEVVEVCGFKDCKRAGGGPRLQKLINTVLEEKGLVDAIKVEGCDCQVN